MSAFKPVIQYPGEEPQRRDLSSKGWELCNNSLLIHKEIYWNNIEPAEILELAPKFTLEKVPEPESRQFLINSFSGQRHLGIIDTALARIVADRPNTTWVFFEDKEYFKEKIAVFAVDPGGTITAADLPSSTSDIGNRLYTEFMVQICDAIKPPAAQQNI